MPTPKKIAIGVKPDLHAKVTEYCKARGMMKSFFTETAIELYFKTLEKEKSIFKIYIIRFFEINCDCFLSHHYWFFN